MPLREFGCETCGFIKEIYNPSLDAYSIAPPNCPRDGNLMSLLWSTPRVDTSTTFHPIDIQLKPCDRNPSGKWHIENLHELRKVEHAYLESGQNVRFDAYSYDESNPDDVGGFGPSYNPRDGSYEGKKVTLPLAK